jgi:hypothetical protein
MNRRHFFRSLAVATAALYLRLAPTQVKALTTETEVPRSEVYDDSVRVMSYGHVKYKGQILTSAEILKLLAKPL